MDMTGNEVTHEKRCNILNYSNAMFKFFSKSSISENVLRLHVGESSGRDKNGVDNGDGKTPVLDCRLKPSSC
jgi:hypothetical protein